MKSTQSMLRESVNSFVAHYSAAIAKPAIATFLTDGILQLDHTDKAPYANGNIWGDSLGRSVGRKAHGWFFLRYWYSGWDELEPESKQSLLDHFHSMFIQWHRISNDSSMAYHDETTAQRVINFCVFLDIVRNDISSDLFNQVAEFLDKEITLLSSEDFYAGSNNHGMFQDIAVLVGCAYRIGLIEWQPLEQKSVDRLVAYFQSCFTGDGVHTENTPSYHLMVSRYLSIFLQFCQKREFNENLKNLHSLFIHADHYGAFCLTPDNHLVPISDTNKGPLAKASVVSTFGEGEMLGAYTRGEDCPSPSRNTFIGEASGYGIYRSDWSEDANYVFFSAAYNADYHKHSDELSLYYFANGRALIAEAGPNGYEYTDPLTKYAFSSAAHNTMLVDGEGLPRIDGRANETTLEDAGSAEDSLCVIGRTTRFTGVDWSRKVTVPAESAGDIVKIADGVTSDRDHRYTFLWHLAEGLVPMVRGNAIEIFDPENDIKLAELTWSGSTATGVKHVKGQRHPYHQGWEFPKMGVSKPASVVEVEFCGHDIQVNWEIRSKDFLIVDRGVKPQSAWKTHAAEKPVNYLLEGVAQQGSVDSLAIIFTAMAELNDFTYNYRASLEGFPGAVLYILDDFGDQGSYYLASSRNLAEFRSVQSLIRSVVDDLGISYKDVITLGSSKGGTAALLHGVTLGVQHVYAGAPQYKIGDFVRTPHPNVLKYISGGNSEADIAWSNDIAKKLLQSGVRSTQISVLVGKKDGHYRYHTVPLIDDLRMFGYSPQHLVLPGTVHSEFGGVFRKFLMTLVQQLKGGDFILANSIAYDPATAQVGIVIAAPPEVQLRAQLVRGSERIGPATVVRGGVVQWDVKTPGLYRARVYADMPGTAERQAFGTNSVRVP
ncbi:heparinase II/III family protein [Corynebacterium glutamicum]|uniref:heparinase II/III domain-containing protein n=1 Tax=Corynebacterium glutamicum TaxID=1718 RepID=UPI0007229E78|nr:heparinase II/III family protein [Corynebacterium glutamicum]ALP49141.1 hypothetical protein AC079_02305 [Corynebacterium glutamicum]ANU32652.1 hypothetical protein BBD29_02125 [Corynebacterium glutamicum]WFP71314.1 heparinase II/III family protein [Corynebacterium glutamicum]BAV22173.1 hypothetical protein CGBL_0104250 [Corynebacterium glutamicum]BCB34130.1 hypothetical protein KaCgl_21040 [Corynebacterium glutamicum]